MTITSKNIFVVKCDREVFERNFTRKKNSDIINHYEIRQKLTNNDPAKITPSEEILEFLIIKKLNNFKNCKRYEFMFFLQENVDFNFINEIKSIFSGSIIPVYYHLLVEKKAIKDMKLLKEFNTVQYLENDKVGYLK